MSLDSINKKLQSPEVSDGMPVHEESLIALTVSEVNKLCESLPDGSNKETWKSAVSELADDITIYLSKVQVEEALTSVKPKSKKRSKVTKVTQPRDKDLDDGNQS